MGDWAREWLDTSEALSRATTGEAYASLVANYIRPHLGPMALRAVRATDIQKAVNTWARTRAPRTVRLAYKVCSSLFRAAVHAGLLRSSPCVGIQLPRVDTPEVEPFTTTEVEALAAAITPRYAALVTLASGTGLRMGELRGLTWDRINLQAGTLSVDRQLRRGRLAPVKSRAARRVVPLPDWVVTALGHHRTTYPPTAVTVTNHDGSPVTVEPVFTSPRGHALGDDTIRGAWRAACARVTPHTTDHRVHNLRHTYASILIDQAVQPKKIQTWMGHSSIAATMDTYGHLYGDCDQDGRDAIDAAFGHTPHPSQPSGPVDTSSASE